MKVSELLNILQKENGYFYDDTIKVVVDKVGVFNIKDIEIGIDADYNEVYINVVEEKGNE